MQTFRAAAVQFRSTPDKGANLATVTRLAEQARAGGAELIALPEVAAWRGSHDREAAEAETVPGPWSDALSVLARRLGVVLAGGSMLERSDDPARPYNTSLLFGPDGDLLAHYRKIHLFDVDIPGSVTIRESDTRGAGDEIVCADTPLGRVGMAVCYDLRFAELFRALGDAGAEVVVMPSSFTKPTGRAHWHTLVRARAIENQFFVVAPDQWGSAPGSRFDDYGHSLIVDPWGVVLADAGADAEGIAAATLDAERLGQVREQLPCLSHRRLPAPPRSSTC